jgi:hypothetical protein
MGSAPSYEVETKRTTINSLESQGIFLSSDESLFMQHKSTVPDNYYKWKYAVQGGMNMDRGGFGIIKRKDSISSFPSSIFACAFDGVSHGGKINAYAAQSFAENCLVELQKQNLLFLEGKQQEDFWPRMYTRLQAPECNPGNVNPELDAGGMSIIF